MRSVNNYYEIDWSSYIPWTVWSISSSITTRGESSDIWLSSSKVSKIPSHYWLIEFFSCYPSIIIRRDIYLSEFIIQSMPWIYSFSLIIISLGTKTWSEHMWISSILNVLNNFPDFWLYDDNSITTPFFIIRSIFLLLLLLRYSRHERCISTFDLIHISAFGI